MNIEQKYYASAEALGEYARKAGFTDVVLGLSGGIDSSLVAVMCAEVFGAQHVHGFMLPGPYSTEHSLQDARTLADNLGITAQVISILEPYAGFERALAGAMGGSLAGLASENTQARCRMVCLMALSNEFGWMLVNTGNKSEAMMGFSTLYGDTAGAFAPLGGLYKTDVFALARWVNERAQRQGMVPPIPQNVLTKPPSAELSPDAEDEKALGIDYATLDKILIAHYEQGKTAEEIVGQAAEQVAVQIAEQVAVQIAEQVAVQTAEQAEEQAARQVERQAVGQVAEQAEGQGFDLAKVQEIIHKADSYAYKRAMEPPFPQVDFYA